MARMSFTSKNRAAEIENFPKLKLENKESARIAVIHEPESAFVHNLRAPKILNGEVQYKGDEMDYDFMGNPICLGDTDVLDKRGVDVKNCPACAANREFPDMFSAPKRRFATHVFQYNTNGTNKAPANADGTVKVWAFADQKFGELVDIYEEAEVDDIKTVDLIIGPCENAMFQKFKIIKGSKTAWEATDATRARFEEAIASNESKDLFRYIGRKMDKDFIEDKIDEVKRKWKQANGQSGETSSDNLNGVERHDLNTGLANLLDDESKKNNDPWADSMPKNDDKKDSTPPDFDELLNSL
jgi:hypothetical protein